MLAPIEQALFSALQFLYGWFGDYGVAIIGLTVIVRVLLLPLTVKQTRSMYELQRIQPKIAELQAKYKNDKEKLQEETMKFYQENKVNPFGGCLPMLIQMPIFFALYRMLGSTGKVVGLFPQYIASLPAAEAAAKSRFWALIPDITSSAGHVYSVSGLEAALPYLVWVVLFGVTTGLPTLMQPGVQGMQKQMGFAMGAMMLIFGWSVSAGVMLYWVTQSLLGLVQQVVQTRVYKARDAKEGAEGKSAIRPKGATKKAESSTLGSRIAGLASKGSAKETGASIVATESKSPGGAAKPKRKQGSASPGTSKSRGPGKGGREGGE